MAEHFVSYAVRGAVAEITLDRKVLADLAVREPGAFKAVVDQAQAALGE